MSAFFLRREISLCLQMACYDALRMAVRCGRLSNCEPLRLLTQPIGYALAYQR